MHEMQYRRLLRCQPPIPATCTAMAPTSRQLEQAFMLGGSSTLVPDADRRRGVTTVGFATGCVGMAGGALRQLPSSERVAAASCIAQTESDRRSPAAAHAPAW